MGCFSGNFVCAVDIVWFHSVAGYFLLCFQFTSFFLQSATFIAKKCKAAVLMRRQPREVLRTVLYRRKHKKGLEGEAVKKRSRRTHKLQKPIEGATLTEILAKRWVVCKISLPGVIMTLFTRILYRSNSINKFPLRVVWSAFRHGM